MCDSVHPHKPSPPQPPKAQGYLYVHIYTYIHIYIDLHTYIHTYINYIDIDIYIYIYIAREFCGSCCMLLCSVLQLGMWYSLEARDQGSAQKSCILHF